MRAITLEEHFASPAFLEGPGRKLKESAAIAGSPIACISIGFAISAKKESRKWMRQISAFRFYRSRPLASSNSKPLTRLR